MSMTARRSVPCWSRLRARLRRLPATAPMDRDDVDREVCQRHPDAAVIVPPRSSAVPSATAEIARTKRERRVQLIAERGLMGCQRSGGYNWRGSVEADIGRYKGVIGHALRSR